MIIIQQSEPRMRDIDARLVGTHEAELCFYKTEDSALRTLGLHRHRLISHQRHELLSATNSVRLVQ